MAYAALTALAIGFASADANAQYFKRPDSDLDPKVLRIDEKAALGRAIDPTTELVDQTGRNFKWSALAGKPTIVVLSYFTCDGSCSLINATLLGLLRQVKRFRPGEDFNLLTVSFDRRDDLATTGAFQRHLELTGDLASAWTFATFKNEADLTAQTEKIGFKFFWSPPDGVFLHPGAFLFFSPKGELARVLYHPDVDASDVELALLDARNGDFKVNELASYAISLCYSYSYHDGKYRLSIPTIVGVGSLALGIATLTGAALLFRSRRRTELGRA